jgi:hypothetical protein
MDFPRGATGGTSGDPVPNGGRNGTAARGAGATLSTLSFPLDSLFSGSDFAAGASTVGAGAGASFRCTDFTGGASSAASRGLAVAPPFAKCCRTMRACSSSSELEWVFFSCIPNSGKSSIIKAVFTSSCRANSLIRILLITEIARAHVCR